MKSILLTEFDKQAAGHETIKSLDKCRIAKPLIEKEYLFYEAGLLSNSTILSCIPKYYGRLSLNNQDYVILENVLEKLSHPSIIDIKLGKRTYDNEATPEKMTSMQRKDYDSTSHSLGFRISGMKIWNPIEFSYINITKWECKELSSKESLIVEGFRKFLQFVHHTNKSRLLCEIKEKIEQIIAMVESTQAELYSLSLLLAYDVMDSTGQDEIKVNTVLIDFAHCKWAVEANSSVSDVLLGLKNCIYYLYLSLF